MRIALYVQILRLALQGGGKAVKIDTKIHTRARHLWSSYHFPLGKFNLHGHPGRCSLFRKVAIPLQHHSREEHTLGEWWGEE